MAHLLTKTWSIYHHFKLEVKELITQIVMLCINKQERKYLNSSY